MNTFKQNEVQLLVDGDMEDAPSYGAELFVDGDMEAAGVGAWTPGNATLTKEVASPHTGVRNLKVTYSGLNPNAYQTILTPGKKYRITGWARGSNVSDFVYPQLFHNGSSIWNGTRAAVWQPFDVSFTAAATTILLQNKCSAAGHFGEFDDVSIIEIISTGIGSWNVGSSATLTKESGGAEDGSRVLRVAYNGANNPSGYQVILTVGKTYRITGWYRGDGGSVYPKVWIGNTGSSTGSTSIDWQHFDFIATPDSGYLFLYAIATAAGYAEFDDILVTEYIPPVKVDEALPPNKNYYKQILVDGDMEKVGVGAEWLSVSANLTKESGAAEDGSQVLRVTGTAPNGFAYQSKLVAGRKYRVKGWVRSDGVAVPSVQIYSGTVWTGTNAHTNWQRFDEIFDNPSQVYFKLALDVSGQYVEFDDVFVTQLD